MTDRTREENGCWLEIEVEPRDIEHPLSDLKEKLGGLRDLLVHLYFGTGNKKKGQKYLVELSSSFGSGLLFRLREALEYRRQVLESGGRSTDDLGVYVVNDSFRTIRSRGISRDVITCWITSSIFDLINVNSPSILQDYHWVSRNPSEYFFMYGDRGTFLNDLLPELYKRSGNSRSGLLWKFCGTPKRNHHKGLSLLEDYYFNAALEKDYFRTFDDSLLKDLAAETAIITGTSPDTKLLGKEMLSIANRVFRTSSSIILEE